eukprot:6197054-Pleurochrysis_carterae.AAC.1
MQWKWQPRLRLHTKNAFLVCRRNLGAQYVSYTLARMGQPDRRERTCKVPHAAHKNHNAYGSHTFLCLIAFAPSQARARSAAAGHMLRKLFEPCARG